MSKSKHSQKRFDTYPKSGKKGDEACLRRSTVKSGDTSTAGAMVDEESRRAAQDAVKDIYKK